MYLQPAKRQPALWAPNGFRRFGAAMECSASVQPGSPNAFEFRTQIAV